MCGISGYIGKKNISKNLINNTINLMKNRGPDYQNYYAKNFEDTKVILIHSRLSIIDLYERSNQPMVFKNYVLIFNGEIYNYLELKQFLLSKNYTFKTDSDTEVLIKLFDLYKEDFYKYLEGMWSFAIFDKEKKKLILSRDRFGEKPLYYLKSKHGIYFGSETRFVESICNEKQDINNNKVFNYLNYGYNSIFLDNKTFKENILSLNPSTSITIDKYLNINKKKYWKINNSKLQNNESEKDILNNISQLLQNALKIRMRSDVKNIFCLSGGIDSGSLVSIASKKFNLKVDTFSIIDSKSKKYNEKHLIEFTLKDTKAKKNYLYTEKIDLFSNLEKIVQYHNSPILTVNYLLHSLMQNKIKKMGYKVVLSGNGADEIFAGYYDHYLYHLYDLKKYHSKKIFSDNYADWERHIFPLIRNPDYKNFKNYEKNNNKITLIKEYTELIKNNKSLHSKSNTFYESDLKNKMINQIPERLYPILYMDDLNSMMNSIENRTPFLDRNLIEYIFSLPSNIFIKNGFSKYLLRNSMKKILNPKVRNLRRKYGFNASLSSFNDVNKKSLINYIFDNMNNLENYVYPKQIYEFLNGIDFDNMTDKENKFLFRLVSTSAFLKI